MYPSIIYDNFFDNPDAVVEYAKSLEYHMNDGRWPGARTKDLSEINPELKENIARRIVNIFFPDRMATWYSQMTFQEVWPMHDDQYHIKNRGWIHLDCSVQFGGIIYLDKNPAEDTGTSLYRLKSTHYQHTDNEEKTKRRYYGGEEVSDEEYAKYFHSTEEYFEETVTVKNVYNRLFLFSGNQYHGVKTFGPKGTSRLTLPFFFNWVNHVCHQGPYYRE
tara:strand:+ start:46 stop:702 length:657 start_codon:yes stop_codon:yes gene_type:complete